MQPQRYELQPYQPVYVRQAPPASGLAVASMVLGIVGIAGGWCLCGLPCILAVILGHLATPATRRGERGGHGMAIAGLVMGYVFVLPAIAISVLWVGGVVLTEVTPTPTVTP